jgi:hypothetical protein
MISSAIWLMSISHISFLGPIPDQDQIKRTPIPEGSSCLAEAELFAQTTCAITCMDAAGALTLRTNLSDRGSGFSQ